MGPKDLQQAEIRCGRWSRLRCRLDKTRVGHAVFADCARSVCKAPSWHGIVFIVANSQASDPSSNCLQKRSPEDTCACTCGTSHCGGLSLNVGRSLVLNETAPFGMKAPPAEQYHCVRPARTGSAGGLPGRSHRARRNGEFSGKHDFRTNGAVLYKHTNRRSVLLNEGR